MNLQPVVFSYACPFLYLNDIVRYRKAQNSHWSLGVWARQLGLAGTSSISRVLSRDRIPGQEIEQSLIKNLQLNASEASYFNRLLERERYYHQTDFSKDIKLVLRNAQALYVVGQVNFSKAARLLEPHSLEPVQVNGQVAAALNFNFYKNTTIGSYNECYMTFTAKHKEAGLLDAGLFFTNFKYNSKIITAVTNLMWGYDSSYCKLEADFAERLRVSTGQETVLEVTPTHRDAQRFDESYETTGYAIKKDKTVFRTKFTIDTIGRQFPIELAADQLYIGNIHGLSELTASLDFEAEKWAYHENLFCTVRDPEKSGRFRTF